MTKVWVFEPLYWLMRKYNGNHIHLQNKFMRFDSVRAQQGWNEL